MELTASLGSGNPLGPDVRDVRLAPPQRLDLARVDVQPEHRKARLAKDESERKADVSLTDHTDPGRARLNPRREVGFDPVKSLLSRLENPGHGIASLLQQGA